MTRLSMSEQKFEKAVVTHGKQIVRYLAKDLAILIYERSSRGYLHNEFVSVWIHELLLPHYLTNH